MIYPCRKADDQLQPFHRYDWPKNLNSFLDMTTPPFRVICHLQTRTYYGQDINAI